MRKTNSTLTLERLKELLHYDPETGLFTNLTKRGRAGKGYTVSGRHRKGYVISKLDGKSYLMHRLAWLYIYGVWPSEILDHIDRVQDNNRIANLREVTRSENLQNTHLPKTNKSGHKGVYWSKQRRKWAAQIAFDDKSYHLGLFENILQAAEAYKVAAAKYHTCNPAAASK